MYTNNSEYQSSLNYTIIYQVTSIFVGVLLYWSLVLEYTVCAVSYHGTMEILKPEYFLFLFNKYIRLFFFSIA